MIKDKNPIWSKTQRLKCGGVYCYLSIDEKKTMEKSADVFLYW
jgi:hypothetical protein